MNSSTKNVGEWSELYALAYLLANGGGYGADDNQEKIPSLFYKILKALFQNGIEDGDLLYEVHPEEILISIDNTKISTVNRADLLTQAKSLYSDLKVHQDGLAFPLASGDLLLKTLRKNHVAASSAQNSDIILILQDIKTKLPTPWLGFSIKSQLNAKATLLNASGSTNFVYEIIPVGQVVTEPIPTFGKSLKDDMQLLVKRGYSLKFLHVNSEVHQQNMDLVDSNLAADMARCLFETTQHKNTDFDKIVELVFPLEEKKNSAKNLKLKQYMGYVMLGMKPAKPWSGQPSDFGGLILVKLSGDVLFYYLYNMESFQNFLYKNLKFEYGSKSRHNFGKPYTLDGKTLINLNLQLRFK
jgi:type II restriction enzyme